MGSDTSHFPPYLLRSASEVMSSAGKNDSIASSASVMSRGVPKLEMIPKNVRIWPSWRSRSGVDDFAVRRHEVVLAGAVVVEREGRALVVEVGQHRIAAHLGGAAQVAEQVRAPLGEVGDLRRHAVGVHGDPQRVGGLQQLGVDRLEEQVRPSLRSTTVQWRSTASAGNGSWPRTTSRTARRIGASSGASSSVSP